MNYRLVFNLAVNIVAAVIFIVLILVSIFSNVEKKKTVYYFLWTLVAVLTSITMMIVLYSIRFSDNIPVTIPKIVSGIAFITVYAASYAFLLYCVSFCSLNKKAAKIICIISAIIGLIFSVLAIVNIFNEMFYSFAVSTDVSFVNKATSAIPFIYVLFNFLVEIVFLLAKKGMKKSEKFIFLAFILVPTIALFFHVSYVELSIFTLSLVIAFVAHFIYFYVQRGLMIQKQEKELSEKQIELTISQIRPHFIYNCLSSISYLCTKDPKLAVEAIDDFSDFLRVNFSNISQNKIVPFDQELEHTMKYLKLEKMRFEDRVRVYFDIRANEFEIPSLTLQPLVENAVKHGICKRAEGGTIVIKTSETDKEFLVEVTDDGVGFDPTIPPNDGRVHVGLENVKKRLKNMVNGHLEIYSKINKGTKMSIYIPKGVKHDIPRS